MKVIFSFLMALTVCACAGNYQWKQYYNTGGTFVGAESWQYIVDVVALGPLASGGTITIAETGGATATFGGQTTVTWTTTNTPPYIVQGTHFTWGISPMPGTGTPTMSQPGVTTSWGGQTNDVQWSDTFTQQKVTSATTTLKTVRRTIVIRAPGFKAGFWNVCVETSNDPTVPKTYMVEWNGKPDKAGQMTYPAQNPPSPQAWFTQDSEPVFEGTTPSMPTRVFRRMAGGQWMVIWSGSIPFGTTQIIYDDDVPIVGTAPDPSAPPPSSALGQTSTGASDGTINDTTGNGLTQGTTGTVGSTSTGGGTGTGGGGSGSGTDGLTEADVEQAVHDGITRAAGDSMDKGATPTLDRAGTGIGETLMDPTDRIRAISVVRDNYAAGRALLDSSSQQFGAHWTSLQLPTVGTDAPVWHLSLPVLGSCTVDLTAYSGPVSILRAVLLGVITLKFFFYNIRIVKGGIS